MGALPHIPWEPSPTPHGTPPQVLSSPHSCMLRAASNRRPARCALPRPDSHSSDVGAPVCAGAAPQRLWMAHAPEDGERVQPKGVTAVGGRKVSAAAGGRGESASRRWKYDNRKQKQQPFFLRVHCFNPAHTRTRYITHGSKDTRETRTPGAHNVGQKHRGSLTT